jgi:hypothetical protein
MWFVWLGRGRGKGRIELTCVRYLREEVIVGKITVKRGRERWREHEYL